jgi:excisionase family DNA binding protein
MFDQKQASNYLGISIHTLYKITAKRQIPFTKGGLKRTKNLFYKEDLDRFLQEGYMEVLNGPS